MSDDLTKNNQEPLLVVRDLDIGFTTQSGKNQVVHGLNITLYKRETLAIVGESGSGKSTTAHAIINLLPGTGTVSGGSITLDGKELTSLSAKEMEKVRGREIGFVPQDPMSNLNPVWSIGFQVEEAIRANGGAKTRSEVKKRAVEVLKEAGLSDADKRLKQFPHQFSGGMKQRVLIGIGLSSHPKLLIADELTSALDVTVQRVILDHLAKLTHELGTTVLFITHDLGLAAERADKILVMYNGRVVESGPSLKVLNDPQHPYTKKLVSAAPSLASRRIQTQEREHSVEDRSERGGHDFPTISVQDLTKVYKVRKGSFQSEDFTAVDQVSFDVARGTTTAIVGESGSGKSTVAKMLLKLEAVTSGSIKIDNIDIAALSQREVFNLRRRMQPVFQDPYGTLDPLRNISSTISEPLVVHGVGNKASRNKRVLELLDQVALPSVIATRYPNELSGGQRQRVAIARALALQPEVVILDEAVSALDVLVQAQILDLLASLQTEFDLTYLFITHDLAVVRLIADNVCVMQHGKIVESASTEDVFDNPQQEYTRALLQAIPGANIPLGQ